VGCRTAGSPGDTAGDVRPSPEPGTSPHCAFWTSSANLETRRGSMQSVIRTSPCPHAGGRRTSAGQAVGAAGGPWPGPRACTYGGASTWLAQSRRRCLKDVDRQGGWPARGRFLPSFSGGSGSEWCPELQGVRVPRGAGGPAPSAAVAEISPERPAPSLAATRLRTRFRVAFAGPPSDWSGAPFEFCGFSAASYGFLRVSGRAAGWRG